MEFAPSYPAITFCVACLRHLRKEFPKTTYLSPTDLARLRVKCTEIDINSGTPNDQGLKVLELKSLDEMNAIAEENRLIDVDAVAPTGDYSPGNWHTATFLGDFYLGLFDKIRLDHRPWTVVLDDVFTCHDRTKIHWRIDFTLESRDKSTPNTVCYLTNEAPFQDDKLLLSELRCILRVCARKLKEREYRNHKTAPVTVVSASGRNLRIVQGYVHDNYVIVRKSSIINVDGNTTQNLDGLMRIGRWFLGNPCGNQV